MDTVCLSFDSGHVIPNEELHVLCCFLVACALFDEQQFFSVYLCTESLVYSLCTLLFESIFLSHPVRSWNSHLRICSLAEY